MIMIRMENMKKISVIIAAYNAEEYLSETMDSIFLQTMNNSEYEVIVINDGSSDSTLSILNSYKKNYPNLIIIDKENGGPSSARNAGLDIAQGEYVFFFDADDLLEPEALSTMYDTISEKHSDLLIGKYDIFNRHTTIEIHNLDNLIELEEILLKNIIFAYHQFLTQKMALFLLSFYIAAQKLLDWIILSSIIEDMMIWILLRPLSHQIKSKITLLLIR